MVQEGNGVSVWRFEFPGFRAQPSCTSAHAGVALFGTDCGTHRARVRELQNLPPLIDSRRPIWGPSWGPVHAGRKFRNNFNGNWRRGGLRAAATGALFDHLVGQREQDRGQGDTKRLCSPQVDHELECGPLCDRQVARLVAFASSRLVRRIVRWPQECIYPLGHCRLVPRLALPDGENSPTQAEQRPFVLGVALAIALQFWNPVVRPGRGVPIAGTPLMTVPEAAVHKDGATPCREHKVRFARQVCAMQPVAVAKPVGDPANDHLGNSVARLYTRHDLRARKWLTSLWRSRS